MHWSCAEQPDSGSPKLGLGWNFFSSFPLSSGSLFASMQFFGHSLQQTRNSVALNITLNWSTPENSLKIFVCWRDWGLFLFCYLPTTNNWFISLFILALVHIRLWIFHILAHPLVFHSAGAFQRRSMNSSVLRVATILLAHSRKAGFVFSVLSQHSPVCIAVLRQKSGSYFRLECFYVIHEPSRGHLLTAQEKREVLERMCQVQPCWMPGSSAAAECVFHYQSVSWFCLEKGMC